MQPEVVKAMSELSQSSAVYKAMESLSQDSELDEAQVRVW